MREREVKAYLLERVAALGGEARKVRWEGRNKAPDWLIMLPWLNMDRVKRTIFAELKATGVKPDALQLEEHVILRRLGQTVVVLDSKESIDACLG